jgi:hypothetical protein
MDDFDKATEDEIAQRAAQRKNIQLREDRSAWSLHLISEELLRIRRLLEKKSQ